MSRKKKETGRSAPVRASHELLAREAIEWKSGARSPRQFRDTPEAVPRAGASTAISLRMPKVLLTILKAFAERNGIGYQVLIKRWIDDRVRFEREKLRAARGVERDAGRIRAPSFPIVDRPDDESTHYAASVP